VTASVAGITAGGMGLNTAITGGSMTGNSSGLSINLPAYLTTAQPVGAYLTTAANSTHTHSQYLTTAQAPGAYLTTAANSTHVHSQYLTTAAALGHVHSQYVTATVQGVAVSASGGSQNTGTISFGNANGMSFGYAAGVITGSFMVSDMTVANLTLLQGAGASITNVTIQGPALYAGAGISFSTSGNSVTVYTV
jgi:hypothetical protein